VALKELPMARQRGICCGLPEVDASWAEDTADLLKALADPTRLTMVASLWKAREPICICDFTAGLELSQPTISHHMAKLKEIGLVDEIIVVDDHSTDRTADIAAGAGAKVIHAASVLPEYGEVTGSLALE